MPSEAGGPSPGLDLRAVERRELTAGQPFADAATILASQQDVAALLAQVRALRAALEPFADARMGGRWAKAITLEHLERAAAVLSGVSDGASP